MAAIDTTDSIALGIRSSCSPDVVSDVDVALMAELFSLHSKGRFNGRADLPILTERKSIPSVVAQCRKLLGLSDTQSAMDLPERLDSNAGINVWKLPVSGTTGGYYISKNQAHIVVSEMRRASPWLACARQLGRILLEQPFETACFFERSRFDDASEKRTLHSKANQFAMELLMPAPAFIEALRAIRRAHHTETDDQLGDVDILWLSRVFGTSFFVAGKRAEQLGLLPPGGSAALTALLDEQFGGTESRARKLDIPGRLDDRFPRISRSVVDFVAREIALKRLDPNRVGELISPLLSTAAEVMH